MNREAYRLPFAFCLLLFAFGLFSCSRKPSSPPPLSPNDALESFRFSEDFHVELFASEPDVVDPVEVVFDENGRAYAAEMIDYPEDPPPGRPARSRIRILESADSGGGLKRNVIFSSEVLQVSGLMPWKGGLIVTSAPDILFLKDTDGDGRADVREVLFTGFPKANPEGRITNPRLGPDNWIYFANNGADGKITSPKHPDRPPVLVRGADFRFHPIRGIAERASGPAQYGLTIDDFGHRFITHNTIHLRHVVVPMRYLARAPLLRVPAVSFDISDHGSPSAPMFPLTKPQHWRVERTRLRQQRYEEQGLDRVEHAGGYFTAATGSTIYNGDVFPKEYWGNIFTGDVSGNLVHRDVLASDGVTFRASRAKDKVEFIASTDTWFRPCSFSNAPDGNLYMADMYRLFIETPESIPEELKKTMDFWAGSDRGRIYRIVPNKPLRKRDLKPNLGAASVADLVRHLENTNGWHRQTAQRLLLERQDRSAVPLLRELAEKSAMPEARVRALWSLEGLDSIDPADVARALRDPHPGVRENAVRLAEPFLSKSAAVRQAILAMASDPDMRVQYQLAFSIGELTDANARNVLAGLALRHAGDQWFRTAILSSVAGGASPFFHLLLGKSDAWQVPEFVSQLAGLIGAGRNTAEIARFLASVSGLKQPEHALSGLAGGLRLAGARGLRVPGGDAALSKLIDHPSEVVQLAAWEAARYFEPGALFARASTEIVRSGVPVARRAAIVRALAGGSFSRTGPVLERVLSSFQPPEVQIASIETLASYEEPRVTSILLDRWKTLSPGARTRAIDALLSHRARVPELLKALEEGRLEAAAIDVAVRPRLLEYPDKDIAARAQRIFQRDTAARRRIVESYRDVLKMKGDTNRGKIKFEENCARCHVRGFEGGRVGPDLSGISNKSKEELLTSILDPSYAIEARYVNYIVTTKDGRIYDGILVNETPGAISLRSGSDLPDQVILREQIAEIRASTISLMPEDVETAMSRQDLADVIAYLRGGL